ncbi:hypothetical protein IWX87_001376 [Polaromonas sp. CG_9.7]|nr:hypothetical protein [Polaromonas sp. CG_9.7]MBG6113624.1 hypothetical protein [Polaromonas sp. CG_9.2]MDH6184478.1 hypothetical protein [Polaromonas sp. CG_23.6]
MLLLPDFHAFYAVCAYPACAGSSLIDSGFGASSLAWFGVDLRLGLRCVGLLAGGCPAASNFLLLRQNKVTKEKATRLSGSLRCASGDLRCPKKTGVGANSLHCVALKQRAALIPFFQVITGPDRTGQAGNEIRTAEQPNSHRVQALGRQTIPMSSCHAGLDPASMNSGPWIAGQARNDRHLKQALLQFQPPLAQDAINWIANCTVFTCGSGTIYAQTRVLAPAPASASAPASPVLAGPVMSGKSGIRAARCLSRRRVCADPRFCRSLQVARSEAKGPRQPGRLSFAYFSLAKQRKVSCRRATPGQPASAKLIQHENKATPSTGATP